MTSTTNYADLIRHMRAQMGITQVELAELLGVTARSVQRWESQDGQIPNGRIFTKILQLSHSLEKSSK